MVVTEQSLIAIPLKTPGAKGMVLVIYEMTFHGRVWNKQCNNNILSAQS